MANDTNASVLNGTTNNGTPSPGIKFSKRKGRGEQKTILLNSDPTRDYRATRTNYYNELFVTQLPPYRLHTGRLMLASDPLVRFAQNVRNAALMPAEVVVTGPNERINKWVQEQWDFIWNQHRIKVTRAKQFGWTPLQVIPKLKDGLLCVKNVKDFAPEDSRALNNNNKLCGHRVKGCQQMFFPQAAWITFDAEYGSPYGTGTLRRMYPAWYEKWMEGGAKKLLQLRMIKDAYIGDIFWYPPNMSIKLPNGTTITWKELMRECGENRLSGGAMTLPKFFDNQGHELTGYTPPQDISGGGQIFEWVDHCDEGILRGADIPVEVIKAMETGSGYSGRSIPFLVVLSVGTQELTEIVQCLDEQVFRPYAWLNFGGEPDYQITPTSLVESFSDDTQGSPMGGGAIGGQPGSAPPQQQPLRIAAGQQQQFSEISDDLLARAGRVVILQHNNDPNSYSFNEQVSIGRGTIKRLGEESLLRLARDELNARSNDDAQREVNEQFGEHDGFGHVLKHGFGWIHPDGKITPVSDRHRHSDTIHEHFLKHGVKDKWGNEAGYGHALDNHHVRITRDVGNTHLEAEGTPEALRKHHRLIKSLAGSRKLTTYEHSEQRKITNHFEEGEPPEPPHEYSCAMFNLPGELAFEVRMLGDRIPSEDLAADGKELNPHVTVKFGLHADHADEVRDAILGQAPVAIQIGKCSCFKAEGKYDVVKLEVESEALHALNKHVSKSLPCTDTHPEYKPHITIAYVKPGLGEHYAKRLNDLQGKVAVFDRLIFSNKVREHTPIPLTGKAQFQEGGIPSNGSTFQFTELEDIVEKLKDFIAKGVQAKLKLAEQRIRAAGSLVKTVPDLAEQVETEIQLLRPVLQDSLTVGMYSGAIEGHAEALRSIPTEYSATLVVGNVVPPTPPTPITAVFGDSPPPYIQFPALDHALRELRGSPMMTGANYVETARLVRAGAFAVTKDLTDGALKEVRDLVVKALEQGETLAEVTEQVADRLGGEAGKLSLPHLETIYRTNIASATSDAREATMSLPLVADAFPYRAYWGTRDERIRDEHKQLEKLGLNGTNIYRADDPTFKKFRPPWDYNCRCSWHGVTVEQAARKGVKEAMAWWERAVLSAKATGKSPYEYLASTAPVELEHVTPPEFEPPAEFLRSAL